MRALRFSQGALLAALRLAQVRNRYFGSNLLKRVGVAPPPLAPPCRSDTATMLAAEAPPAASNTAEKPSLCDKVSHALTVSPYIRGNRVRVEAGDGHVRLHGDVGTFFEKQMAQEVVRRLDGVQRVENLLQVAWT